MIITMMVFLMVLTICWINYSKKRVLNFPPGPIGLPVLGHLPLLGKHPWKTLWQWRTTYGPVIGVWFGSYRSVVISDARLIREAMNMNVFAGRPKLNISTCRAHDGISRGVVLTEGPQWIEQRRFIIKNLKDFGFGTKPIEAKIQDENYELLKSLRAKEGQPIQVKGLFNIAVLNVLWSIMFSVTLQKDDPDTIKAIRGMISVVDSSGFGSLSLLLPWIAKIAPRLSGFQKVVEGYASVLTFLRNQIAMHNMEYVGNQPRDFVDAYTDEVEKTNDVSSSFHARNDVMLHSLLDLFSAGAETTSTTLSWLCAYLTHHQHVQEKFHKEIDDIIGRERVPSLADRSSMPYTEAVIREVMRFSSIFPLGVFHNSTEDVIFQGFFIPKDTVIIPNMYSVHFDQVIWGDPDNFRPERFIDANGKFQKNENVFPFSTGKRTCLGEGLARDELFLFATNLFQTFSVSAAGHLPSLEPYLGLVLTPQPFELVFKTRVE